MGSKPKRVVTMLRINLCLTATAILLSPAALSAEGLSLDECLDLAARGNLSLLQQQERLEIARADVDVQAAAGWPRLFVSSSARYVSELARLEVPFLPSSYQGTEMGAKDQYDIYAGLTVPIFTGKRTRYQVLSAEERLARAAEEGRQIQNLVDLRVRQLYYAWRKYPRAGRPLGEPQKGGKPSRPVEKAPARGAGDRFRHARRVDAAARDIDAPRFDAAQVPRDRCKARSSS